MKRFLLILVPLCSAFAQSVAGVSDSVLALRKYVQEHQDTRGGVPQLTAIKHQLRDWSEVRLASFPQNGDVGALNAELHAALAKDKLFCDDEADCFPTTLGYLDEIQLARQGGYLTLTTAVGTGVRCGYDGSAYAYEWADGKWRRVWENEQNDYAAAVYQPQSIHAVQISGTLILTLGSQAGCLTFRDGYTRLWRRGTSAPILDRRDLLYDEGDPASIAVLKSDELRVQFSASGGSSGYPHKALRRFTIDGNNVKQTDTVAPTPRDFVAEWLAAQWTASVSLAESPALQAWHKKLHREGDDGDFPGAPVQCTSPELWQIATRYEDDPDTYFLVRWRRVEERMTMVEISDKPIASCKP